MVCGGIGGDLDKRPFGENRRGKKEKKKKKTCLNFKSKLLDVEISVQGDCSLFDFDVLVWIRIKVGIVQNRRGLVFQIALLLGQ